MAKLHEVKTKVTFRPKITIEDGAFDVNICPVCGGEIRDVEVYNTTKEGIFKDLNYRYAEIECPECGAEFKKTVYDNYEEKTFLEVFSNFSIIIFIVALIGLVIFSVLIYVIPDIALTVVIVCFSVLVVDSIIRLFLE